MKRFKTTGLCNPNKDYMVDITERLVKIKAMVDYGDYFTINRARQFGKTTTLNALKKTLCNDYYVLDMDFQNIDNDAFLGGGVFSQAFTRLILDKHEFSGLYIPDEVCAAFKKIADADPKNVKMDELFREIKRWCLRSDKPIVLMIDEVDSASNNQVFLDFLAQLRLQYLNREADPDSPAFQSVILAGVTDIKHLKSKIRDDNQTKVNSPWNIAAEFDIDMSLHADGIKGMLDDYEADHHTGMDTTNIAQLIYDYTSGYPFLVSRICQIIDEKIVPDKFKTLSDAWTRNGIDEAVKAILIENNTLFDSLMGKLTNYPDMKELLRRVLMEGYSIPYSIDHEGINQLMTYGFIKRQDSKAAVANRIFETRLYNMFCTEDDIKSNVFTSEGTLAKNIFIKDGKLDMRLIMERFIKTYTEVFGPLEGKFKEKDGREQFLLYLRPIINGTGNYYIEAQTRDQTRTDIVVDYLGQQYIIELKIWRGERYNAEGEQQLSEYLDYFGLDIGYMLSFNFNKKKDVGVQMIKVGDKTLYEGTL